MNTTFPKTEKLCGSITIDNFYKSGKRFVAWPMRITYMLVDQPVNQVLIWAPKSLFKRAVDRNKLRRQMREAYRLNKALLVDSGRTYMIAFNYIDKQMQPYTLIDKAVKKALNKILKETAK